ncbi:hypothetical protein AKO1_001985 [Acrasis kona]|uniref:Uncharacterized protein n=1 Tax=Acrasis kona TaxID=1008807 RepID=A0AAW2ZAD5_9EUKA
MAELVVKKTEDDVINDFSYFTISIHPLETTDFDALIVDYSGSDSEDSVLENNSEKKFEKNLGGRTITEFLAKDSGFVQLSIERDLVDNIDIEDYIVEQKPLR